MTELLKDSSGSGTSLWWSVPNEELINILNVNVQSGLTKTHVEDNRKRFGSNTLEQIKPTSIGKLVIEGIRQPMMILLLSIAGISLLFGKIVEAMVMIFVVVAYVAVEFVNKFRSDRVMTRLRELTAPTTRVIRESQILEVPTADVVVGDILVLSEGSSIPVDARLIESFGLLLNEAPLTGESRPQEKRADVILSPATPVAERVNCVFSGTTALSGEGKALVMAVGERSEFGRIAKEVTKAQREKTVLQTAMGQLAKTLAILAVIVSALIPAIGFLRGLNFQEMIITWLALTFLMIPGQPPIIITMALALASFELAKKNLIVKHLHGAETLGQITELLTDKTGTITENKMRVASFILSDGSENRLESPPEDVKRKIAFAVPRYSNDPTDTAIKEALGNLETLTGGKQPFSFKGFSEGTPWRVLSYKDGTATFQVISGKPELLIDTSKLPAEQENKLKGELEKQAQMGKRVIAYAFRENGTGNTLEGSHLVALAVLEDAVRAGVDSAFRELQIAGIGTLIVTGDHPVTTRAVAEQIGLKGEPVSGTQLESMADVDLNNVLKTERVFARVTPSQKLRLVETLKARGEVVAVIGDGINDAPALRAADASIAMGEIGTDLAKETADLVLTDDNYVHLPQAISVGRKALDNFRKGLTYYLSAKTILISIFIVPLILGIPFPFAPIHIILTELLMDLASSTIFVAEAVEPDILRRPPQRIKRFLTASVGLRILRNGVGLAAGILLIYLFLYFQTHDTTLAQTAAFTTWLLGHIFLAMNLKQEKTPLFKQGFFSNRFAIFWLSGMIGLTLVMTLVTPLHPYLKTTNLPLSVWFGIILVVIVSTFWIEVSKLLGWKRNY